MLNFKEDYYFIDINDGNITTDKLKNYDIEYIYSLDNEFVDFCIECKNSKYLHTFKDNECYNILNNFIFVSDKFIDFKFDDNTSKFINSLYFPAILLDYGVYSLKFEPIENLKECYSKGLDIETFNKNRHMYIWNLMNLIDNCIYYHVDDDHEHYVVYIAKLKDGNYWFLDLGCSYSGMECGGSAIITLTNKYNENAISILDSLYILRSYLKSWIHIVEDNSNSDMDNDDLLNIINYNSDIRNIDKSNEDKLSFDLHNNDIILHITIDYINRKVIIN